MPSNLLNLLKQHENVVRLRVPVPNLSADLASARKNSKLKSEVPETSVGPLHNTAW